MKRTKVIALVLSAAIMMMGAGYAYWSETLTINNTITTGELAFEFKNAAVVAVDTYMDYDATSSTEVNVENNNTVDIVLEDMYPGAEATVAFDLENTGTMQAVVKNFAYNGTDNAFFLVTSLLVNNIEVITTPVAIANLETTLAGEDIAIEPDAIVTFEVTFQVDPLADNDDVLENTTYNFSLTADGLQYNDDVN